jgi:NAD(P)-dependent dehydrogenase (short-subunit alcohol dehydrogenase family)
MLRFDDQVVLITGAGRGIGRQHALFFGEFGAKVVVNDFGGGLRGENGNNPVPADEVVATIKAKGGTAIAACCDIGDSAQVKAMMDDTIERFGRIDIVIHNASTYAELGSFTDAKLADLERILRVNVTGGWNVAHAAWPHMLAQGYGRMVITGSGAGFFGRRNDQAYSVAKSALMGLTKVLAAEGATKGIKCNMVGPIAFTDNARSQGLPGLMEKFAPPIYVTNLVAGLSHADCPVNGEMFHCGGGFVARVFVGETEGVAFAHDRMSPEGVMESMGSILDDSHYKIPFTSDRAGAHLSASMAAANPEFKAALADEKARQGR